ncbi:MAG: response regulator [Bacteroidota bacterium]
MDKALVLIVEDQVLIAKSIEAMIVDHGMEVIGICKSGEEAIALSEQQTPDLVIMDIRLNGKLDGIQTAKELQLNERIPIIYLSDYTDKTTVRRAKETRPANYLSKPFTEQDLLRAIDIAIYNSNELRAVNDSDEEFVFLKTTGQQSHSRFLYSQINFVEAERSYCKVHTPERVVTLSINMAAAAEQLSKKRFIKIYRSYLVNIRKITEFTGTEVVVAGHRLPVSDKHRADLVKRLNLLH